MWIYQDTPATLLPSFLKFLLPHAPVQSVDEYVRKLGQSRDNQTKRGWPILWVWGSVPRALRASGSPAFSDGEKILY